MKPFNSLLKCKADPTINITFKMITIHRKVKVKFITCDIDTYNTSRSGQVDKCIRELLQSPQQSTDKVQFTNQVCNYEALEA